MPHNNETITAYFDLADNNPIEASFSLEEQAPIIADFGINVVATEVRWGEIYGNLIDQLDLVRALELLYPKSNPENYTSNTNTIRIWYKDEDVAIKGLEIEGVSEVHKGGELELGALPIPRNASNTNVVWGILSGNENIIITPHYGTCTVHGVQVGQATVQVSTEDGEITATKDISVIEVTPPPVPVEPIWELDCGNRYSDEYEARFDHTLFTPKLVNYYLNEGDIINLIDSENYMWQMTKQNSEHLEEVTEWSIGNQNELTNEYTSYIIPSDGYYALIIKKVSGENFDLAIDSTEAFDYITVTPAS